MKAEGRPTCLSWAQQPTPEIIVCLLVGLFTDSATLVSISLHLIITFQVFRETYEAIIKVLCFATTVRAVHKILEQRYHNIAWPATELPISQLQSWILRRVNEASGPYQMIGVLGDIILLRG